ncbi:MAG: OmpH family outer membrane protein [Bacteroidia bacterium]
MTRINWLFSAFIVLLLVAVVFLWVGRSQTVYVNLQKVYDAFELKKELDQKLIQVETLRQQQLDSMKISLSAESNALRMLDEKSAAFEERVGRFNYNKQNYLQLEQQFGQDNENLKQQYMGMIWKQINEYASSFAKENGYDLVVGGDGTGAVMFSSASIDVTDSFITHLNKNYKSK